MSEETSTDAVQILVDEARGSPLSDVIVAGFVDDSNGVKMFHPMMDQVYLKLGSALFMLSSSGEHSSLLVQRIARVTREFDIDEDDEFCTCSVAQMFLSAPYADSTICSIDWLYGPTSDGTARTLKALGLLLERQEYMFFDPLNYFGIQIGGKDRREAFIDQNSGVVVMTSEISKSSCNAVT